ncbi:MAG TPA: aldo/keto reductase [Caldilineaceae bacterium]|nr:aldo/keto reductase [Caldilineaceae bacterium]
MLHYRPLGKTGAQVSEIAMGCNRLGEAAMPDSHWIELVQRAVELGVTLFDTSESYGWGRSEEILGQALGNRDDVLVASKVSRMRETNAKDFSAARIIQQVEGSLRRLRRERIDLYQLHSPSLADLQRFDWPEAMSRLRDQGKIRFIGVSINDAASGHWLIEQGLVQVLQVGYNLLEHQVGDALFPQAQAAGIGILVRVPMAQGILTGKFRPGEPVAEGHRAHLAGAKMEELIAAAENYRALAAHSNQPLGQFALRYAISPPAVSAAIPGARTVEQLAQNVAASNGAGLSPAELAAVAAVQTRLDAVAAR